MVKVPPITDHIFARNMAESRSNVVGLVTRPHKIDSRKPVTDVPISPKTTWESVLTLAPHVSGGSFLLQL